MDIDRARLVALISATSSKTIVPLNEAAFSADSGVPQFYCLHGISGVGSTDFVDLAHELDDAVRFFAVQIPKQLMMNSEFAKSLGGVADHHADAITKFQPQGQINLGGWSSGALVALETARQLKARGRAVGLLVSFDGAPINTKVEGSRVRYISKVLTNLPLVAANDDIGRLCKRAAMRIFRSRVAPASSQPSYKATHPVEGLMETYSRYPPYRQAFIRSLYDAIEGATFEPYDGKVIVYKARIEPFTLSNVPDFWTRIASNAEIVPAPGTHMNLVRPPNARPLAVDLNGRLHQVS